MATNGTSNSTAASEVIEPVVLLAEDEDALRDVYTTILEPICTIRAVQDGNEAVETIDEEVDILLIDRRMPSLDGDKAVEEIRAAGYDPKVAMITAVDRTSNAPSVAVDEYLSKPTSNSELRETVTQLS